MKTILLLLTIFTIIALPFFCTRCNHSVYWGKSKLLNINYRNQDTLVFESKNGRKAVYLIGEVAFAETPYIKGGLMAPAPQRSLDVKIKGLADASYKSFYNVYMSPHGVSYDIRFSDFAFNSGTQDTLGFPALKNRYEVEGLNEEIRKNSYSIEGGDKDIYKISKIIWNWKYGLVGYEDNSGDLFIIAKESTNMKRIIQ